MKFFKIAPEALLILAGIVVMGLGVVSFTIEVTSENLRQQLLEEKQKNEVLTTQLNEMSDQLDDLNKKIDELSNQLPKWTALPVYTDGTFKSFMDGSCITDTSSAAYWQMQRMSVVNGIYMEGNYAGVAMSDFYGNVGDKFRITLSSKQVFYAVMTDTKQSSQLDENYAHPDGSVIEFIVDTDTLPDQVLLEGSLNCIYTGSIEKIDRME